MRKLSLEEKKNISLEVLKKFDAICKKNGLVYYLGYGSLLGAIRHKGFIPWDDDIDVVMLRKDYVKLHKIINSELKNTNCCFLSSVNNSYPYSFAKIVDTRTHVKNKNVIKIDRLGIGIDIFPFDYLGNNLNKIYKNKNRLYIVESFISYSLFNNIREANNGGKSIRKSIEYIVCKTIGWKNWCKLYAFFEKKYIANNKTTYCGMMSKMCKSVEPVFNSRIFDKTSLVEFEGCMFPAPSDYDSFLKTVYHDYMKLPPENERVAHSNIAYINDDGKQ